MDFIDSLYILFSYVHKQGEIWTVEFVLTNDQVKKLHYTKSWLFMSWTLMTLTRTLITDYETLASQHKNSLYYSESKEEKIVEEERQRFAIRK